MSPSCTTGDPSLDYCLNSVSMTGGGGWMAYFNAYDNELLYEPLPNITTIEPFSNYIPTSLECSLAGSGGTGTGGTGPWGVTPPWSSSDFFPCIIDAAMDTSVSSFDPCFTGAAGPGTGVSGVVLHALDDDNGDVVLTNGDDGYTVVGVLEEGLYEMHLFTTDGGVLSTVVEVEAEEEVEEPAINTAVDLSIAPNPIAENNLLCYINSTIETPVNIRVSTLDGAVNYVAEEYLTVDSEFTFELAIEPDSYPYGQIIITLTFDDGSSIQEIAIVE